MRADGSFVLVHQTQDRLFQYACLFECLFSSALAFFDEFEAMIRFILAALIQNMTWQVLMVRLYMCGSQLYGTGKTT